MQKTSFKDFVTKLTTCGMIFLFAIILLCPLFGTIFSFFNIKWGVVVGILILVSSIAIVYYMKDLDVFKLDSITEWGILVVITVVTTAIYKEYAPSLSVQQDQSVYMMKALNLVNYGYIFKPMNTYSMLKQMNLIDLAGSLNGYGAIENGNTMLGNNLHVDFYAGGTYFYALCGLIKRNYVFYGQVLITIANTWLLYFALKNVTKDRIKVTSGLYTLAFILSPICVWFGRSSSTETMALFLFLLIFLLLLSENINTPYCLILPFTVALIGRIDYFLISMIGIFIITYKNKTAGLIATISTSIFAFFCSKVFWIYYNRICVRDMKLVKYQIPLFILVFIMSIIIFKVNKEWITKLYNSAFAKISMIIWGIVIICMMFRDTFTTEENWGRFTEFGLNIRSYEECIMDHLFLVFPSFVLLFGLIGAYRVLKSENINMLAGIYIISLVVIYSYFVYKSGNAPQMYFLLRRYYNIFIPALLIFFAVFMNSWDEKSKILVACVCVLLSGNLLGNSKQQVEYAGLEESVRHFAYTYDESKISTIFYNNNDKYDISPIVSYCSYDVVPLQSTEELDEVCKNNELYDYKNAIYVTKEPLENIDTFERIHMDYSRMGENFEELPKEYYFIGVELYVYQMKDLIVKTN